MPQELKIIQDFYDLMLWTIRHTEKFPRHHRYSLGLSIENRLQDILHGLLQAKYDKTGRSATIARINLELEVLRYQFRLAKDLGVLPIKSHGFAAQSMVQVGSQLGGWARSHHK